MKKYTAIFLCITLLTIIKASFALLNNSRPSALNHSSALSSNDEFPERENDLAMNRIDELYEDAFPESSSFYGRTYTITIYIPEWKIYWILNAMVVFGLFGIAVAMWDFLTLLKVGLVVCTLISMFLLV